MTFRRTTAACYAFALPLVLVFAQSASCGGAAGGNANRPRAASEATNSPGRGGGGAADADAVVAGGEMKDSRGQKRPLAAGTWGGTGVRLDVKDGTAEVEFDCAHGTIEEIATGADGEFTADGTFVRERGGPVRADEEPERVPARYSGSVSGETMTLRVSVRGSAEDLNYTLTRGRQGRLRKCL